MDEAELEDISDDGAEREDCNVDVEDDKYSSSEGTDAKRSSVNREGRGMALLLINGIQHPGARSCARTILVNYDLK